MSLKDILKENKGSLVGHFSALLTGSVLGGVIASMGGETLGYGALSLYVYGLVGHKLVAKLIKGKVK